MSLLAQQATAKFADLKASPRPSPSSSSWVCQLRNGPVSRGPWAPHSKAHQGMFRLTGCGGVERRRQIRSVDNKERQWSLMQRYLFLSACIAATHRSMRVETLHSLSTAAQVSRPEERTSYVTLWSRRKHDEGWEKQNQCQSSTSDTETKGNMATKTRRPVAVVTPPPRARSGYSSAEKQSLLDNFDLEGGCFPSISLCI